MKIKRFLCFVCCVFFVACTKTPKENSPSTPSAFTDITQQIGLNFVHEPGVDGSYFMPESMGSGGAFFDYNNDGRLDIYLINGNRHGKAAPVVKDRLYRQNRNGVFQDVTESSGLGDPGYGMGVAIGDIDNDGDLDVYVTNFGGDSLYRNNGNETFTNITNAAGIRNREWGTSTVFLDYDLDGYLDLYVANYVSFDPEVVCMDKAGRQDYCGPKGFEPVPDVLYHNNRDGTFKDVSRESNIGSAAGKGLGVISADFNKDSFPDIYVANDGEENFLWMNKQNGTFENQAVPLGAAVNALGQPEASMGVAAGDVDRDLDLDLFMTHLRDEKNTFYRNLGNGDFQDESWAVGLAAPSIPYTGFGTGYFDYDNDTDLDLAVVNGRVTRGPLLTKQKPNYWDHYAEPNFLFENDGSGKFRVVADSADPFASTVENSRGLAFGDLDNDGDIDLLVTNEGGPARVYRNDSQKKGHWLVVKAVDPVVKRDAIGAEITVSFHGKKFMRLVAPGYSYLSSSDPRVHFGLGTATAVDAIEVRWPDGSLQKFSGTRADQFITLNKR